MKKILLAIGLMALMGAGCTTSVTPSTSSEQEKPTSARAAFDAPVTFSIGQRITFMDGISIKLTAINDSRCKEGVQCIWAGELAPAFTLYDTDESSKEFTLGTVRTATTKVLNYSITLESATTEKATITVSSTIK